MQPLEDDEDALEILLGNADSIIARRKVPASRFLLDTDPNLQRPLAAKFNGVADEVLKQLR